VVRATARRWAPLRPPWDGVRPGCGGHARRLVQAHGSLMSRAAPPSSRIAQDNAESARGGRHWRHPGSEEPFPGSSWRPSPPPQAARRHLAGSRTDRRPPATTRDGPRSIAGGAKCRGSTGGRAICPRLKEGASRIRSPSGPIMSSLERPCSACPGALTATGPNCRGAEEQHCQCWPRRIDIGPALAQMAGRSTGHLVGQLYRSDRFECDVDQRFEPASAGRKSIDSCARRVVEASCPGVRT